MHHLNRGHLQRSVEHANDCHQDELRQAVSTGTGTRAGDLGGVRIARADAERRRDPVGRRLPARSEQVIAFATHRPRPVRARRHAASGTARRPLLTTPTPTLAGWGPSPRSPTGSGSRATSGSTSTSASWAAPRPAGGRHDASAGRPARSSTTCGGSGAGERGRGGQHARALRPHLRQRGVPCGVRRIPIVAHEVAAKRDRVRGRAIKGLYTPSPTTRTAEVQATEIVPADRTFSSAVGSTSATGRSSWCTRDAGTPRRPGAAGAGRRRAARRRPGRGVGGGTACPASAATATRWSGRLASTSCSA